MIEYKVNIQFNSGESESYTTESSIEDQSKLIDEIYKNHLRSTEISSIEVQEIKDETVEEQSPSEEFVLDLENLSLDNLDEQKFIDIILYLKENDKDQFEKLLLSLGEYERDTIINTIQLIETQNQDENL